MVEQNQNLDDWNLHRAAQENREDIVSALIAIGADIETEDDEGWTPLHWAARMESFEVAQLLIQSGADIEAEDNEGWTPLSHSGENYCGTSLPVVAQLLVQYGANTKGVIDLKVVIDQWLDDQKDG